ncbi:MAG: hypothetical protein AB8F95_19330 [Bacteroidia bacterium]
MIRLIQILQHFNQKESRRFLDLVRSPFFNTQTELIPLAQLLLDIEGDDFDEKALLDNIKSAVFTQNDYSPQRLADRCTYLTRLAETFIFQLELAKDTAQTDLITLRAYQRRGLQALFKKRKRKLARSLSTEDYERKTAFARIRIQANEEEAISVAWQQHEYTVFTSTFRWACSKLNRQSLLALQGDIRLAETLDQYLNEQASEDIPSRLSLWRNMFHLLKNESPKQYEATFRQARSLHEHLAKDELQDAYSYLLNMGIGRYNRGDIDFRPLLFDLYKWLLERKILLEAGNLNANNYKNILTLAVQLQQYDWAERYLLEYRPFLPQNAQQPAYAYNLAVLRKAQGNSHEALKLLQEVTVDEPFYQLGARTLLAKIYYENEEHEALFSSLGAFEAYLRRAKHIGKMQVRRHQNFVKLLRRLNKLRLRGAVRTIPKVKLEKLTTRFEQETSLTQRSWLLEMIGFLGCWLLAVGFWP